MRTAKLFKNGGSQAVRLPKEFRFEGSRVFIRKMGDAVVLLPHQDSWDVLFDSLEQFTDDFMATRDQPASQVREGLFE
jgi:antitoxin VapB